MIRLELRRFALRATRRPELLPVLQDALLEHYGEEFEHAIARAHRQARAAPRGSFAAVVYSLVADRSQPRDARRASWTPRLTPLSNFDIYHFAPEDLDYTWTDSWVRLLARRGRVPVYLVPTGPQRVKPRAARAPRRPDR